MPGDVFDDGENTVLPVLVEEKSDDLAEGTRAGAYLIGNLIGRGGCGKVYHATHDGDGKPVAVKVLHRYLATEPLAVERFLREVHTVNLIKHPNIIAIAELGRMPDERPFFAMELLEGLNLRRLLQIEGRMAPVEAYEIVEQVCAALEAAHAVGVVHRDLKAENVIVDSARCVKLVDFGIAKLLAPDANAPGLTTTRQVLGTLIAMAPEQLRCEAIDARTDIYALGVLVYNMLTGVPPFRGSAEDVARMHLESPPRPPSALVLLPPAIDAVVLRCLEKDAGARYPTVPAFLVAFRAAVFGEEAPTRARTGVGVLVRATPSDESDDALADAALALDIAESELRAGGCQIALQTSSEVMGVLVTANSAEEELATRRRTIALAHQVHEAALASVGPGIRVAVTVHCNEVRVRGGDEVAGGPLLEIGAWTLPAEGVTITPRAAIGIY
jgi:serine/threonine-protein kinase